MTTRRKFVLAGTCAVLTLLGCGSSGQKFSVDSVPNIRRGSWTQSDVRRQFGPPQGVSVRGSGREVWRYRFEERSSVDTGFVNRIAGFVGALLGQGIPGSPVNVRRTNQTVYRLDVEFDREGIVRDYEYTRDSRPSTEVY